MGQNTHKISILAEESGNYSPEQSLGERIASAGKKNSSPGKIYLIPVTLSDSTRPEEVLPASNLALLSKLDYFVVENLRSARRFLKSADRTIDIDRLDMRELSEHTPPAEVEALLQPVLQGRDAGVLSEAGCPAVADPGCDLVAAAQRRGIKVIPLVGPSSILMSLMASGFNGQHFEFLGYLPIDKPARNEALRRMERRARHDAVTQIFIETPYRNQRLLDDILAILGPDTGLCVATDITGTNESIVTRSVAEWKRAKASLPKSPSIFLIGGSWRR